MNRQEAQNILDNLYGNVFGYKNQLTLEQFMEKYAFDVRLPVQVNDSTTGQVTWSQSLNPTRYITMDNAREREWEMPPGTFSSMEEVLTAWQEISITSTERSLDSIDVLESDNIYNSEKVFRSMDINRSKNILFCDGIMDSEFLACSQRSNTSNYSIRIEDSKECTKSFSVSWSAKVVNSFFIHDCFDMFECLFCSHISSKRYCIANRQFEEAEYFRLKDLIIRWIISH